jgi:hAT family C-terminal dimerisation region
LSRSDDQPDSEIVRINFGEDNVLETGEDFFSSIMGVEIENIQQEPFDLRTPKAIAESEMIRWEALNIDWAEFLREHQYDIKFDVGDVQHNNPYRLVESVDIPKWWKVNDILYPWIARAAPRRLVKPSANSLQERVFSFLKRIDSPLRQRLGHNKFEMIALLGFNMGFIMSAAGMDCFESVINSLRSATSIPAAAESIREFFDLDENDFEGHGAESLESMLKDFIRAGSSKRPCIY